MNKLFPSQSSAGKRPQPTSRRAFLTSAGTVGGLAVLSGALAGASQQAPKPTPAGPPDELFYQSATKLAEMIRTKQVSSEEVVQAFLDRIAAVEPKIQAVLHLAADQALARAREADAALGRGENGGPLHGVPISLKDELETAGIPCTCGAPAWKHNIPTADATVVMRLRRAGAIILAKTNMPFLGAAYESKNLFRETKNPYDLSRTPGGSSGGEAALIAAGGSPFGIGNDQGGSIRVPAHFCGIAGLRPAHGRVSLAGNIPESDGPGPVWHATNGPMARCVEDLGLLLPLMARPDVRDPFTLPLPQRDYRKVSFRELRVAWWTGDAKIEATTETSMTVEQAAKAMERSGACVQATDSPYDLMRAHEILLCTAAQGAATWLAEETKRLGAEEDALMIQATQSIQEALESFTRIEIESLQGEMPRLRRSVRAAIDGCDAILCPVTRSPAAFRGTTFKRLVEQEFVYCQLMGLVWSLPTGVIRCGTSPEGLPIGVQVVGAPLREDIVLAVMARLEHDFGGWQEPSL